MDADRGLREDKVRRNPLLHNRLCFEWFLVALDLVLGFQHQIQVRP